MHSLSCKFAFIVANMIFRYQLQVPLGVIFKDENVNEDMLAILQKFHSYLPTTANGQIDGQIFTGDQLTVERSVNEHLLLMGSPLKSDLKVSTCRSETGMLL